MNGAACKDTAGGYICICKYNFKGVNCEGESLFKYKITPHYSGDSCNGYLHRGFMQSTVIFNRCDGDVSLFSHGCYSRQ